MKTKFIFIALFSLLTIYSVSAQNNYRVDNEKSSLTVTGTSNVHDWEMSASGINASIVIEKEGENVKNISSVIFSLPAKNLASHNSIMDKKTWEAIKADKYNTIRFNLSKFTDLKISGDHIEGTATGQLTIAGETNMVTIPFTGSITNDNRIQIEGLKEIKLTEFNVAPPTAMMGTLKTGETVNIVFNLQFISA